MVNTQLPGAYFSRLIQATINAQEWLKNWGYVDPVSRRREYSIRTVLPGAEDVLFAYDAGLFNVCLCSGRKPASASFTGDALVQWVVEWSKIRGTSPSILPLEGILERFVSEMEVLPQAVELELQGRLSETKRLY